MGLNFPHVFRHTHYTCVFRHTNYTCVGCWDLGSVSNWCKQACCHSHWQWLLFGFWKLTAAFVDCNYKYEGWFYLEGHPAVALDTIRDSTKKLSICVAHASHLENNNKSYRKNWTTKRRKHIFSVGPWDIPRVRYRTYWVKANERHAAPCVIDAHQDQSRGLAIV